MTADVTAVLNEMRGNPAAADRLAPLVYEHLRAKASTLIRGEGRDNTVQPTALVHEAFLKLVNPGQLQWQGSTHFFAVASRVMQQILIDHARTRRRDKRGGGWKRVGAEAVEARGSDLNPHGALELAEVIEKLAKLDPRQARIVEMRVYTPMTESDIADHLGVARGTVQNDWNHAKAWLKHELAGAE